MSARQFVRIVRALLIALTGEPSALAAQSSRLAVAASVDFGTVPALFDAGCSRGNVQGTGLSGGLVFEPTHWLVLEGKVRRLEAPTLVCELLPQPSYPIGNNEYETLDSTYTAPRVPLIETFLRAGVETPPSMPLVRAMIGAGTIQHSHMPVGSLALGIGTRGHPIRLYGEFETFVTRLHLTENHHAFAFDSLGGHIPVGSHSVPRTAHLGWSSMHLGIEVPLFAKRVPADSSR